MIKKFDPDHISGRSGLFCDFCGTYVNCSEDRVVNFRTALMCVDCFGRTETNATEMFIMSMVRKKVSRDLHNH